jgi:hypothetical protein
MLSLEKRSMRKKAWRGPRSYRANRFVRRLSLSGSLSGDS